MCIRRMVQLRITHELNIVCPPLFPLKVNQETLSDTVKISELFSKGNGTEIPVILSSIQGPYAFIYLDVKRQHLYFGRDRLGRHSLLWSSNSEEGFVLTSVGKRNVLDFKEVPTVGIFMVDMNSSGKKADDLCHIYIYIYKDASAPPHTRTRVHAHTHSTALTAWQVAKCPASVC